MDNRGWFAFKGFSSPVVGHTLVDVQINHGSAVFSLPAYQVAWSNVTAWRFHIPEPKNPAPAKPIPEIEKLRDENLALRDMWRDAATNEEKYFDQLEAIRKIVNG